MPPFFYIIPGILDQLEDARAWDFQAQAWLCDHSCGVAAGFNYFADVIGGVLSRDHFASMVADDLQKAQDSGQFDSINIAAHSNGCAIALTALQRFPKLSGIRAHLIAAAIDHDCDANGLNEIVARGQIEKVVLYTSAADEVLGLPVIAYGDLGKAGPTNVSPALAGILERVDRECGHCDWVGKYFEETMENLQRVAGRNE